MNQLQKLKLVSLLEDGFTYNNSKEVRHLVGLSDQAYNFYNSLLSANKKLHSFYQSRELKRVNNNLNKFIDKQLQSTKTISLSRAFSGILAICCALFLSIGVLIQFSQESEDIFLLTIPETLPKHTIKNYEFNTIWSLADKINEELNASIYQVMFAMYLNNTDAFINADLNNIRGDVDLVIPNYAAVHAVDDTFAKEFVESFL